MKRFTRLACLVLGLGMGSLAHAQQGNTASIIGLMGRSLSQSRKIEALIMEVADGSPASFEDVKGPFEKALAAHLRIARDLRSAFSLANTAPGYNASDPVSGLSANQVRAFEPNGFYYAAINEHRNVNDLLVKLLTTYGQGLPEDQVAAYKANLDLALAAVPLSNNFRGRPESN